MFWKVGKRVVYVLGGSIFATVAVMAVWSRENAVEFADVGTCVSASALGYGASGRQAECTDPDAQYLVATKPNRHSECPAPGYASFVLDQSKSTRIYMCLAPNLEEGRCYADVGAPTSVIGEVACPHLRPSEGPADGAESSTELVLDDWVGESIQVVHRRDATADATVCPEGTTALVYPEPQLTYCVYGAPGAPPLPVA